MVKTKRKRLGDLLIENNMITQTQLDEALRAQAIYGGKLGTNLVELGFISESSLTNFLSTQLGIPAAKPEDFANITPDVISLIPREFALQHKVIPLNKSGKRLKIAISDPYDIKAIDELSFKTSMIIDTTIAPEILIVYALETHYGVARQARYIKLTGVTSEEMRLTETLADEIELSPMSDERPKTHPYPVEHLSRDLAKSDSKEEIFNILFKYFEFYFQKLAVFVVRHSVLSGFLSQGFQISRENLQAVEVPLHKSSVFRDVMEKQVIYSGEISGGEINNLLKTTLKIKDGSKAYVIPLLLNSQTISVLLCHSMKELTSNGIPLKDFDIVAKKISYAFQIQFLRKRILSQNN